MTLVDVREILIDCYHDPTLHFHKILPEFIHSTDSITHMHRLPKTWPPCCR